MNFPAIINLMRILRQKTFAVEHRLALRLHFKRFKFRSALEGTSIKTSNNLIFHVPLLVSRSGMIEIGAEAVFGNGPAKLFERSNIQFHLGAPDAKIRIGERIFINQSTALSATTLIEIGNDCLIGDQVSILDSDFHAVDPQMRRLSKGTSAPIHIGNNVWIAARVMIMKGVTIGDNTVVAAGAIVTRSLPANVLAGGIPAKAIRSI